MTRLRNVTVLGLIIMSFLFLSASQNVAAGRSDFIISQVDATPPTFVVWGIDGNPERGNGFYVWANVTDDDSGVRNVTAHVTDDMIYNITILMTFNGTYYTALVPVAPAEGYYTLVLRAFDMDNNTQLTSEHPFIVDTTRPNIYAWGIEGDPLLGEGFDVWAIVTDTLSGLRNVTVQVSGPNMTAGYHMTYNGTYYVGSVPAFPNDGLFLVRIRALDMVNNSRLSYQEDIDYVSDPVPVVDPVVTLPIVVGSSVGIMVVVSGIALVYDRRKSLGE
jgi:hypothetical protein